MIKLKEISFKQNNNLILDKITFSISEGNFIVIYGQNGSGKTTLAKILTGFYKHSSGEYFFKNELIDSKEKVEKLNQSFHFVFQNIDHQFVYDMVKRDLAFGMENKQFSYEDMSERVDQARKRYRLENIIDKKIFELSGGQKQKVAIATSWIDDKEIIVFDESTAMLDPNNLAEFWDSLRQLKKENKTVILITHSVNIPLELDWRFFVIDNKKLKVFEDDESFFKNNLDNIYEPWIKKIVKFQFDNNLKLSFDSKVIAKQLSGVIDGK